MTDKSSPTSSVSDPGRYSSEVSSSPTSDPSGQLSGEGGTQCLSGTESRRSCAGLELGERQRTRQSRERRSYRRRRDAALAAANRALITGEMSLEDHDRVVLDGREDGRLSGWLLAGLAALSLLLSTAAFTCSSRELSQREVVPVAQELQGSTW